MSDGCWLSIKEGRQSNTRGSDEKKVGGVCATKRVHERRLRGGDEVEEEEGLRGWEDGG
jgi:hypothetical protein